MRCRSLQSLIVLTFLVTAHRGVALTIDVRLVTSRPDASATHPGFISPRFTSCSECVTREFESPGGFHISVVAERNPRVQFGTADVEHLSVFELRALTPPYTKAWYVAADLNESAVKRYRAATSNYVFDRALVAVDGKPTQVGTVSLSGGDGVILAGFRSPEEAKKFAETLKMPISWIPFDEADWEKDRQRFEHEPGSGTK